MSKLFDKNEYIFIAQEALQDVSSVDVDDLGETIDEDVIALESQFKAYNSLTNITTAEGFKDFSFVTMESAPLFNEYLNMLKSNFGISTNAYMALESNMDNGVEQASYHIALEGVIGSMWNGIKNLFLKIGNSIKEFFKRHFTKLGRTKARLEALSKALNKTDKDLKELTLEKVPGSIKTAFPYDGAVSDTDVKDMVATTGLIVKALGVINKEAEATAKMNVLDSNFVANLKALRDQYEEASDKRAAADGKVGKIEKAFGGASGFIGTNLGKSDNYKERESAIKNEASIASVVKQGEATLKSAGEAGANSEDDIEGLKKAREEVNQFFMKVVKALEPLKGKKLPRGKTIKTIKSTMPADNDLTPPSLEIEIDEDKDSPTSVSLGSRATCLTACDEALKAIQEVEKVVNTYGKVNTSVEDNIKTVDKLIKELDRIGEDADAQKYKKVLQNQVKARLNLMKNFFVEYNKVNKNLLGYTVDVGAGVVVYVQESMKRFG